MHPAEGVRAKDSRMKRSNGGGAGVGGGRFGGFPSIRGDFTVAYGRDLESLKDLERANMMRSLHATRAGRQRQATPVPEPQFLDGPC